MTCIVGLVDKSGTIHMGGDSAGIGEGFVHVRVNPKVFVREDMIFGFTDSFRMGQLLQYKLEIPPHPKNMPDHAYLATEFISAVLRCFGGSGFLHRETNGESRGGTFLLGYKRTLYYVGCDFAIGVRADGFDSVGQGQEVAMGSLFSTRHLEDQPEKRVLLALEASAHLTSGVRPPFHVLRLPATASRPKREPKHIAPRSFRT